MKTKRKVKLRYRTYAEASKAAQKLGIRGCLDYKQKRTKDPMLPARPNHTYIAEWEKNNAWQGFLGDKYAVMKPRRRAEPYETIHEAREATINLGIDTPNKYIKFGGKLDPKLPADVLNYYGKELFNKLGGWNWFLDAQIKQPKYETYEEAQAAAHKLGIKSSTEYLVRYKEDPKLVVNPRIKYNSVWKVNGGWRGFLNLSAQPIYESYSQASKAAQALGLTSQWEYRKRYKEDPRLPSSPEQVYPEFIEMGGLPAFLGLTYVSHNAIELSYKIDGQSGTVIVPRKKIKSLLNFYVPTKVKKIELQG